MSKHVRPFVETLKQLILHNENWKVFDYRDDADHLDIALHRQFGDTRVAISAWRFCHISGVVLLLNGQLLWLHPREQNSLYKGLWKVHRRVKKHLWQNYCAQQKALATQIEQVLMAGKTAAEV
jgi:hypothetical protein